MHIAARLFRANHGASAYNILILPAQRRPSRTVRARALMAFFALCLKRAVTYSATAILSPVARCAASSKSNMRGDSVRNSGGWRVPQHAGWRRRKALAVVRRRKR